jgi:hypothetical protein
MQVRADAAFASPPDDRHVGATARASLISPRWEDARPDGGADDPEQHFRAREEAPR